MTPVVSSAYVYYSADNMPQWGAPNTELNLIDGKMDLGHWRNAIANRIYPNFYDTLQISQLDQFANQLSFQGAKMYFNTDSNTRLQDLKDGKSYFFTFDYDQSFLKTVQFQENPFKYDQF